MAESLYDVAVDLAYLFHSEERDVLSKEIKEMIGDIRYFRRQDLFQYIRYLAAHPTYKDCEAIPLMAKLCGDDLISKGGNIRAEDIVMRFLQLDVPWVKLGREKDRIMLQWIK